MRGYDYKFLKKMSINNKEIERITKLQVGKKCNKCKVGNYVNVGLIICDNCGKEPFKNY